MSQREDNSYSITVRYSKRRGFLRVMGIIWLVVCDPVGIGFAASLGSVGLDIGQGLKQFLVVYQGCSQQR